MCYKYEDNLFLHSLSPLAVTFNPEKLLKTLQHSDKAEPSLSNPICSHIVPKLHLVNHTALRLDPKLH